MKNEKESKKKDKIFVFLLLAIILFHSINNYIILTKNELPMFGNEASAATNSLRFYSYIKEGDLREIIYLQSSFPIFIYILPSILYPFFGTSQIVPPMINLLFLTVLIFSIYGIGKKLHSREAGLLAAFIVTFLPHVFELSRVYFHDFPMMCSLTLAVYFLIKTEKFLSFKYSAFFGISTALCAVLKPTFSVYLAGPFLVYLIFSFINKKNIKNNKRERHEERQKWKQKIRNISMFLLFFLIFASPVYIFNSGKLLQHASNSITLETIPPTIHTPGITEAISNFKYYFNNLLGYQMIYIFFIIFIISIVYLVLFKRNIALILMLSWIILPIIFYSCIIHNNTDVRFTLPILPAIAILLSFFVLNINSKSKLKSKFNSKDKSNANSKINFKHKFKLKFNKKYLSLFLILLIIAVGLSQFFLISYFPTNHKLIGDINEKINVDGDTDHTFQHGKYGPHPSNVFRRGLLYSIGYDWKTGEIVDLLKEHTQLNESTKLNENNRVLVSVFNFHLTFEYLLQPYGFVVYLIREPEGELTLEPISLEKYDYFITSNALPEGHENHSFYDYVLSDVEYNFKDSLNFSNFNLIGNISGPENKAIYVYKKVLNKNKTHILNNNN